MTRAPGDFRREPFSGRRTGDTEAAARPLEQDPGEIERYSPNGQVPASAYPRAFPLPRRLPLVALSIMRAEFGHTDRGRLHLEWRRGPVSRISLFILIIVLPRFAVQPILSPHRSSDGGTETPPRRTARPVGAGLAWRPDQGTPGGIRPLRGTDTRVLRPGRDVTAARDTRKGDSKRTAGQGKRIDRPAVIPVVVAMESTCG